MPFGSRRAAFLAAAAEPADDFDRLLQLADKIGGADFKKRLADLAAQTKAHAAAKDAAEIARHKADASVAAAKAEVEKLHAAHQAHVARELKQIEADRKVAAQAAAEAEAHRQHAAELVAEQRKRLAAVEKAIAG